MVQRRAWDLEVPLPLSTGSLPRVSPNSPGVKPVRIDRDEPKGHPCHSVTGGRGPLFLKSKTTTAEPDPGREEEKKKRKNQGCSLGDPLRSCPFPRSVSLKKKKIHFSVPLPTPRGRALMRTLTGARRPRHAPRAPFDLIGSVDVHRKARGVRRTHDPGRPAAGLEERGL